VFVRYNIRRLTPERIPEAFPVVAFLDGEITAQQWSDYASAMVGTNGQSDGHGIMTLQDPQKHIVGLSAYHTRPDLQRGRILVIENFAIVSLIKAQQAGFTLLAAMEDLARDLECPCLAVSLLDRKVRRSPNSPRSRAGRFFAGAGFRLDLARLRKCIDAPAVEYLEIDGANGSPAGTDVRQ